jgi:HD-GYP domain-containing protein (c-di-GMP phosphodiesterase class II)
MGVQLRELSEGMVKVDQPLKWDVFSAKGELLLQKGYVVRSESQLYSLLERGMHASAADVERGRIESRPSEYDPFMEWDLLRRRISRLGLSQLERDGPQIIEDLSISAGAIATLIDKNPDAAIFELMQMDLTNYVAGHNLQTAVLVALLSKRMNWAPANVNILSQAAATMNIAILELQSVLAAQKDPITAAQRALLADHGRRGRTLLERMGVTDGDWLRAVEEHHPEAIRGSEQSEMAGIIHHADVYLAKVSPRAYRIAKPPNLAAKEMFQGKGLRQNIAGIIIKEIGIYPPGSYVRLANGETAIVTERGAQAHTPTVFSLVNGVGMPLGEPIRRDTQSPNFAVAAIVPRSKVMVTINRAKLFHKKKYTAFG